MTPHFFSQLSHIGSFDSWVNESAKRCYRKGAGHGEHKMHPKTTELYAKLDALPIGGSILETLDWAIGHALIYRYNKRLSTKGCHIIMKKVRHQPTYTLTKLSGVSYER